MNKPQLAALIRQDAPSMPKEKAALYAKNMLGEDLLDLSERLVSNQKAIPTLKRLTAAIKKQRGDKLVGELRRSLRDRAINGG